MTADHRGEEDCARRFPSGKGYQGCMCDFHVLRRAKAEDERRSNGVERRSLDWGKGAGLNRRAYHAAAARIRRAKVHGGRTYCDIKGCGAGPFKDTGTLGIHKGKVHKP